MNELDELQAMLKKVQDQLFVAKCVDDGLSEEILRLWKIEKEILAKIKLCESHE